MRIALCQMNATVGDIAGNGERITAGVHAAADAGAELVLFPELALTGYPPQDLLLREHFLADTRAALERVARDVRDVVAIVGFPERAADVHNAAAVLADGAIAAIYRKVHLPNYGVFDERRYFHSGAGAAVIELGSHTVGLTVCEDVWEPGPPATDEALAGATLIVNISASPYHAGKGLERERMFSQRARDSVAYFAFCGLVGGQDELLFDGHSFVVDHTGETIARARQFEEDLLLCDVDLDAAAAVRLRDPRHRSLAEAPGSAGGARAEVLARLPTPAPRAAGFTAAPYPPPAPIEPLEAEVYAALCLGLRDYVEKNGFARVVLGISGGIDSALVACIAVDALGADRVSAAVMPSQYSSAETQADAHALAAALGVEVHELPIAPTMQSYLETLRGEFNGRASDLTEENLQARIRGNLLMALSNKFGWLVLTTGNKSEMSVGYTTLYGDLAGGFAVIKDVPKTLVYRLCEWRNSPVASVRGPAAPIPRSIIERPPSAELRPDQRDEDSLPPYELLDRILRGYIELHLGRDQLIEQGLPGDAVEKTIRLVDLAEYKRRQAPPGIKVTERAFDRDRRMPITNRFGG
ncbi:MAG TPA: NAD+ synthase [Solirubrobacteraceae bacterium]|nr:NAD+ synthase [Solirubrobacteraceae bacterium]